MRTLPGQRYQLDRRSTAAQAVYRVLRRSPFYPSPTIYNLTISDERKFVWFRIAKVGTRTIYNHLKEHASPLTVDHVGSVYYPVNAYADYFKFAFVRNPWSRLVSCWLNKVVENQSHIFHADESWFERMQDFATFVDYVASLDLETCDRHLRLQCRLIDLSHVDFIGRQESFNDDFAYVCRRLGLPEHGGSRKNSTSDKKPYYEYYTDELRERVGRLYERDIKIFGYDFLA